MTWAAVAAGAAGLFAGIGSYKGSQEQAKAQESANVGNIGLTREGWNREDEINQLLQQQFGGFREEMVGRLTPYTKTGEEAQKNQAALLGLQGPEAQAAAMKSFQESPGQAWLRDRQEKALLRNASKIGGLGGGNVRTALEEQAYNIAAQDYQNQLDRLGAVSQTGLQATGAIQALGTGPGYTGRPSGVNVPEASNPSEKTPAWKKLAGAQAIASTAPALAPVLSPLAPFKKLFRK